MRGDEDSCWYHRRPTRTVNTVEIDAAILKPVPGRVLVIAMTPRTGSTQLCSILGQLGNFGAPKEIFNPRGAMPYLCRRYCGDRSEDYLVNMARGVEVFCFKVAGCDWQPIASHASRLFPQAQYVHLQRHDLDAQALSLARAIATGTWHQAVNDREASDGTVRGSLPVKLVARCRQQIEHECESWIRFFREHGIRPLPLWYEDSVADPACTVRRICQFANVDIGDRAIPSGKYRKLPEGQGCAASGSWRMKMVLLRSLLRKCTGGRGVSLQQDDGRP
jgi:LPS sulfotransferase NodH